MASYNNQSMNEQKIEKLEDLYEKINTANNMKHELNRQLTNAIVLRIDDIKEIRAHYVLNDFMNARGKVNNKAKKQYFESDLTGKIVNSEGLREAMNINTIATIWGAVLIVMQWYKKFNGKPHPAFLSAKHFSNLTTQTTIKVKVDSQLWKNVDDDFELIETFLNLPDDFWITCAKLTAKYEPLMNGIISLNDPPEKFSLDESDKSKTESKHSTVSKAESKHSTVSKAETKHSTSETNKNTGEKAFKKLVTDTANEVIAKALKNVSDKEQQEAIKKIVNGAANDAIAGALQNLKQGDIDNDEKAFNKLVTDTSNDIITRALYSIGNQKHSSAQNLKQTTTSEPQPVKSTPKPKLNLNNEQVAKQPRVHPIIAKRDTNRPKSEMKPETLSKGEVVGVKSIPDNYEVELQYQNGNTRTSYAYNHVDDRRKNTEIWKGARRFIVGNHLKL